MTNRLLVAVLLLGAACATGGRRGADVVRQADHGLPAATEFPEGPERAAYAAAHAHEAKGDAANGDAARAEWAQAAAGYVSVAASPAAAGWRVPLRHRAAELFLRAQRWDEAASAARALVADAAADETSKAIAARLAATATLGAAGAASRAGQLEKLELGAAARRDAARPPPAGWQRVVDATDAYLARAAADPEARRPAAERRPGVSPAELALVAAEVRYAYGDLDGARQRLDAVLERWPDDGEVLEQAVPLYLATFAARGDRDGHDAAIERLRTRVAGEAGRASAPRQKEAFAKVLDALSRAGAGARFGAAERLLASGKAADAARAFEAIAGEAGAVDPANALHNAAVAWDKAGEPARAATLRERILTEHASSPVAAEDALSLAAHHSRAGDHLRSARVYEDYLARWPESENRCVALQNVAFELDVAGRRAEAAARYLVFGKDEGCAKAEPDIAARALVHAGKLFEAEAKAAYGAAAGLPGVGGDEAKKKVAEAKRRLRELP